MTAVLDFTIPSDAFAVGAALDVESATQIELARFVPVGERLVPYFWAETSDAEAVQSEVRASPHVAVVERLDGSIGRPLFRVSWEDDADGFLDTLRRRDIVIQRGTGSDGTWLFRLISDGRDTFSEFHLACREGGYPLDIKRLSDSTDRDSALYGLTGKQRVALLHAFERGYYDMEQNVKLGDICEDLDISQQAFGARLKRGMDALIENTLAA
ncbi:helix-turn-helix domain-containing protein [Halogeometricum luteum]|uniref:Helix-turn-helix domain-containing protein n=1 Tax=Halogeometricum luteum TaxID=2950537 RepID=A0ABU2FZ00_9EURY|nr:helix-turn-helix domain-containing protein [Halogeometricum sp. S3BR5-2]MDS0293761.1 helix-turn-helix domain-containing protein [Halogeometricum sp. S3BR5-2]